MTPATVRANLAFGALMTHFWNEERALFEIRVPFASAQHDLPTDPFHYWWQAHGLDVLVDAFERDGDGRHLAQAARLLEAVVRENGSLTNDYYDDMLWLALACLRAWDAGGDPRFRDAALTLWDDIQGGWNDHCGGGITWRKPQLDYKNTPANAPAIILATRLYARLGREEDLAWARRLYRWQVEHLVDPDTGFVWDGLNRLGDGELDRDWAFTYCQGVQIGAALELHAVTGERSLLDAARRTVAAARARLADPATLALPDEGDGDAGLFKGILARYLAQFARVADDEPTRTWLTRNAALAWQHRDAALGVCSTSWTAAPGTPVELSAALSGVMLFEAAAWLHLDHLPPVGRGA
ncbi:glycoside hydrolase family 76 protein [Deinococcus sonorensis]|uniref:Glycoside hydrolase family 76 protein n=2 Tax=Deinococcus sonorensis TaxID=309891 RepID=A0AAU7U476_9DEIO